MLCEREESPKKDSRSRLEMIMANAVGWPQCESEYLINDAYPANSYLRWPRVSLLELGPLPTAASCARLHTRNVLAEWELPRALAADVEMCVSGTITNALRATVSLAEPQPIALRLLANRERLVAEAWDCHPGDPVRRTAVADDEGGRGLAVIEACSNRWGVRHLSANVKSVWCELIPAP